MTVGVVRQCKRTFVSDHDDGKEGERLSFPYLQKLTKFPLVHIQDLTAPWDFESAGTVFEHKDRNVAYGTYKETMIKYLKVWRAEQEKRRCIFVFRFTDGLYYIRYKKSLFDTFKTDVKKIADRIDYEEKEEKRIYIPREHLIKLADIDQPALFVD